MVFNAYDQTYFFVCFYEYNSAYFSTFPESVYCISFSVCAINSFVEVNTRITTACIIYWQAPFGCLAVCWGKLQLLIFEIITVKCHVKEHMVLSLNPFNEYSHVDTRSPAYVCMKIYVVYFTTRV